MFKDIDIFVTAAQAIWNAQNPYTIPGVEVYYPLPFYFLFLPFAWLPRDVTHAVWSVMSGIVLVALFRRRALVVILSTQAVLTFLLGQVDIVMMALYALTRSTVSGGGIALAFLVLKPQVVILLAPFLLWNWWRTRRRELVWFVVLVGILVLASWIAQPDWAVSLLSRSGERMRTAVSSSLWGMLSFLSPPIWILIGGLAAIGLVIWAWRTRNIDIVESAGLFISPVIFAYNLMPLYVMFRQTWVLVAMAAISWLGFFIADLQSNDRASALVTVLVLVLLIQDWRNKAVAHKRSIEVPR